MPSPILCSVTSCLASSSVISINLSDVAPHIGHTSTPSSSFHKVLCIFGLYKNIIKMFYRLLAINQDNKIY